MVNQLQEQFIQLFHRRISQRDLMNQFYSMAQEVTKTVPQFIIWFQNLRKQLTRSPTLEKLMEVFLTGLREPMWTTLAVVGLIGSPIEYIISRVLRLDNAQSMSMTSLQNALPTTEETQILQAV